MNKKKIAVTGCAGFIGSNCVDRLLSLGNFVFGIDNFSTGQKKFLSNSVINPNFKLFNIDLLDFEALKLAISEADVVFHFAANADVRYGVDNPRKDLEQNTLATHNLLEAMRQCSIKKIIFSSTGSVYGESIVIPTPEDSPFPIQTSLYGASKVSCEGLISAYCESYGFNAWIFRFVSILGERYSHGHIFDFYKQLKNNPNLLKVLGDGNQKKSYLYVHDCISAILLAYEKSNDKVNIFNLGTDEYCKVTDSIEWMCKFLNVSPLLEFSGGDRGWVGDNPYIFLETQRIQSIGWRPKFSIREGVIKTVEYLKANEWVFESRA
jgi:UDP-glucose 4-epimerase